MQKGILDMNKANLIFYGVLERQSEERKRYRCQEEVSEEELPRGRQPGVDYTTYGNLRKIKY